MREVLQELNKRAVAQYTGISYSRLRKYASAQIKELTEEEREAIIRYLLELSSKIKGDNNDKTEL